MSTNNVLASGPNHTLIIDGESCAWLIGTNCYGQGGLPLHPDGKIKKIEDLPQVTSVSAGENHSIFLAQDGSVWVLGSNAKGQLGTRNKKQVEIPKQLKLSSKMILIASADSHSLFLDDSGTAWGCGNNKSGQLGLGRFSKSIVNEPTKISKISQIVSIHAGSRSSLFLNAEGQAFVCGYNNRGRLGLGTTDNICKPTLIPNLPPIVTAAISTHSLLLDAEGCVWGCGHNSHGQLGVSSSTNWLITECTKIDNLPSIKAVACGNTHSVFLDNEGSVWMCGLNEYGELGFSDKLDRNTTSKLEDIPPIICISAGYRFSFFVDINFRLWPCGFNAYSQLGLPEANTPQLIDCLPSIKSLSTPTKSANKINN